MIPLESSARMITLSAEAIARCVTANTSAGSSSPSAACRDNDLDRFAAPVDDPFAAH
ncbi:hypothetical protein MSM1_20785 [Mycobacterium sp. SM1]|uniref:hypothetical protein n=1 Tax=Mycobacterium sp. SM1 TaxID=2816243 RepID=UPI001BCFF233|nr:hypothetical protein [Mycobacterium sp. SM1]MBS4730645.1 hypothetical protein [Mycobacterium sp. SM1]